MVVAGLQADEFCDDGNEQRGLSMERILRLVVELDDSGF
jgi:hypothetical protein